MTCRSFLFFLLFSVGLNVRASATPIEWFNPINFADINTNTAPFFRGETYWQGFNQEDFTSPSMPNIRLRGAMCLDGRMVECEGMLPGTGVLHPLTLRITEFVFSCDSAEGCEPIEIVFFSTLFSAVQCVLPFPRAGTSSAVCYPIQHFRAAFQAVREWPRCNRFGSDITLRWQA